jgi:REP element-mobilizing transposase RayT
MYRYFVTICTDQRLTHFSDEPAARWMCAQIPQFFEPSQFAVTAFCVMPDHVHLLLEALADDADFTSTMRSWKQTTGYAWKQRTQKRLWQEGYYDRVLRDHDSDLEVVRYILDNPNRAGLMSDNRPYPYMGSSRFTMDQLREAAGDWSPYDRSRRE